MATTFNDYFYQADETPLSSGGAWSVGNGITDGIKVVSNKLEAQSVGTIAGSTYTAYQPGNDQFVQIQLVTAVGATLRTGTLCLRRSTSAHTGYFIDFNWNANNVDIYKFVGGVFTDIQLTGSITVAVNDVFKAVIRGFTISVYQNDTLVASGTDAGASISSGYTGLEIDCKSNGAIGDFELDNFYGGDLLVKPINRGTRPRGFAPGLAR